MAIAHWIGKKRPGNGPGGFAESGYRVAVAESFLGELGEVRMALQVSSMRRGLFTSQRLARIDFDGPDGGCESGEDGTGQHDKRGASKAQRVAQAYSVENAIVLLGHHVECAAEQRSNEEGRTKAADSAGHRQADNSAERQADYSRLLRS